MLIVPKNRFIFICVIRASARRVIRIYLSIQNWNIDLKLKYLFILYSFIAVVILGRVNANAMQAGTVLRVHGRAHLIRTVKDVVTRAIVYTMLNVCRLMGPVFARQVNFYLLLLAIFLILRLIKRRKFLVKTVSNNFSIITATAIKIL